MNEAPHRLAAIVLALGISGLILGITISLLPIAKIDFVGEPLELSIDTVRLKNVQVSSWPGKFFGAILGLYISTQLILIVQSLYYKNKIIITLLSSYAALILAIIFTRNIYKITKLLETILSNITGQYAVLGKVTGYINDIPVYIMLAIGVAETFISSHYWLNSYNKNNSITDKFSTYAGASFVVVALVYSLFAPHIVINVRPISPVGASVGLSSEGVLHISATPGSIIRNVNVYIQTVKGRYYLVFSGSLGSPGGSIDLSEAIRALGGPENISKIIVVAMIEKDNQVFIFSRQIHIKNFKPIKIKNVDIKIYYNSTNLTILTDDIDACSALQYVEVFWHVYNLTVKSYTAGMACGVVLPSLGGPLTVLVYYTGPDGGLRSSSIVITSYGNYVLPVRVGVVG